jgi:hypothetical protein
LPFSGWVGGCPEDVSKSQTPTFNFLYGPAGESNFSSASFSAQTLESGANFMTSQSLQILVIGGYGVFGGRLIRLLADDEGLTLFVAGRSKSKAEAFCRGVTGQATVLPEFFERLRINGFTRARLCRPRPSAHPYARNAPPRRCRGRSSASPRASGTHLLLPCAGIAQ